MKKVLFLVAFSAGAFTLSAQNTMFQARVGANAAMFTGEDADDFDTKIGAYIGAAAHIEMSENLALQPEVAFSLEGAKIDFGGDDVKYNLNYVNIPVMLQYKTGGFYVEAGPQIGLLLSAKAKVDDEDEDIKDFFKSTAFGVNFGLGYNLGNGFGIGARYTFGISSILEDDDDGDIKQSAIRLGVHYNFGGGSKSE